MAAMRLDLIGRYLRPHRKTVIFGAIALVVVNVLSVTIPMEVRRVIDELQVGFAYDRVLSQAAWIVLLASEAPGDGELTELARLLIRYDGFPGAEDLQQDMQRLLTLWSLSRDELNHQVRALWAKGYRPGAAASDAVGSGFDTSETSDG